MGSWAVIRCHFPQLTSAAGSSPPKRYHPHLAPCDNITNESLIQQLKLAEKDFILCRDGKGGIQIDTLEMASTKPTKDMSEGAGTIPVIFNIYRDKHKDESSSLAEEGVQ